MPQKAMRQCRNAEMAGRLGLRKELKECFRSRWAVDFLRFIVPFGHYGISTYPDLKRGRLQWKSWREMKQDHAESCAMQ